MNTYNRNLETQKIELHFEKSTYMALPEETKKKLKSNFLWSNYAGAWVSRAKGRNTYFAEQVAKELNLTWEGETGEKLSFAEQIERTQEKAETRAEYMAEKASKFNQESAQLSERSMKMTECIPFGQPILVGHHSERRHRNLLDRSWNMMGKAVETGKKADYYEERAETAQRTADGKQFSSPVYLGNRIREVETKLRELDRLLYGIGYINRETGERYTKENPYTISEERRTYLEGRVAEETEKLNFFKEKLLSCGVEIHTKESLKEKKCTHVNYRGTWYPVKSINAKSVTVLNWMGIPGAAWKWTVHFPDIKGIKTIEDMFLVYDRDGNESKPQIKF